MKNFLVIVFLFFSASEAFAQNRSEHRERIKALKTAFITEGLSLTAREAQKFWPVYNKYEEARRKLYKREHAEIQELECLTEEAAEKRLGEYVEIEKQDYLLKKQYYKDLRSIFTAKRVMQLKKVEDDFNEKLMREYRSRKDGNQQQ